MGKKDKTIHRLFEEQVEKTPDCIAVIFQGEHLTYRELKKRTDRWARVLREKGVRPDTIVAIMVGRSVEMIIGTIAILKAGGAYLPIDPAYPRDRIRYMLEDSSTPILLTTRNLIMGNEAMKSLQGENREIVYLDRTPSAIQHMDSAGDLPRRSNPAGPSDSAYIIYTSGTTGRPKGVIVEHGNVVRLLFNEAFQFDFSSRNVWTMFHSLCFDFSVWEMYGALLYGGKLIIVPVLTAKDTSEFIRLLEKEKVTVLNQTPSAFYNLIHEDLTHDNRRLELRYVIFGGEALSPGKLSAWQKKHPAVKLINMFGITETTVHVTFKEITRHDIDQNISNIGKPIPTLSTYIMNDRLELQPVGKEGELCVGGAGVARGYLNRPELTAAKFVDNPYKPGQCLYLSGDLGRLLENGDIVYLGRIDRQVKIRGFRIETGEIETLLVKQEKITGAVVIARGDNAGAKYLCAYITAGEKVDVLALKNALAKDLPDYMIPSCILQIDAIPLTANGKTDREALPEPPAPAVPGNYVAPENEIEKKMTAIWAEILHLPEAVIGVETNFFELGGHSLNAAVLIAKVHKNLDVKLTITDIFNLQSIRLLAAHITQTKGSEDDKYADIEPVEEKEYYPQTSAQKRLFIIQQMEKESTAYNIQLMDIHDDMLEEERVEAAFKELIKRHESLRTSFLMKDGKAVQRIHDPVEFKIECCESLEGRTVVRDSGDHARKGDNEILTIESRGESLTAQEIISSFVRPFDLTRPPLLRVGVINVLGKRQIHLLDIHHIISDGISMGILVKEFRALYEGKKLPPLKLRYKDFAHWQNSREQKELIQKQGVYWLNRFQGDIPVINLPTDFVRPAIRTFNGDAFEFDIPKDRTRRLYETAKREGVTLYMLLLAGFYVLLSKLSGQEDIVVGAVTVGREHADLYPVIGMFVNTLAMRNFPEGAKTFKQFLAELKEQTIAAFENQDYPFEELVSRTAPRTDNSRHPLFDVSFGLENQNEKAEEILAVVIPGKPKPYRYKLNKAKFDITLIAVETVENLQFNLEYDVTLFKQETIERFARYYKAVLASVSRDIRRQISEIEIISQKERNQLLYEFNDTRAEYPEGKTIHQLFEEQAAATGDPVAVVGAGHDSPAQYPIHYPVNITYRELNRRACQLALVLQNRGVTPQTVVGIIIERSVEMAVGILGILKAGAAYLPIDPEYPLERIHYMLADSCVQVLVTTPNLSREAGLLENPQTRKMEIIYIDLYPESAVPTPHPPPAAPESLAYIIYTSGTSGRPKGVAVEHRGVVNTLVCRKEEYNIDARVIALQLFSYAFDGFVASFFTPIISGAKVIFISSRTLKDIAPLRDVIVKENVTHFICVPPLYAAIIDFLTKVEARALRVVTLAGDKVSSTIVEQSVEKNANLEIAQEYGVTEASVMSTISRHQEKSRMMTIGKPARNTRIYIVNPWDQLQPVGVPGELCIAGPGLARGYLNRPQLTAQKFTPMPSILLAGTPPLTSAGTPGLTSAGTPGLSTPFYRTGDLARWLPDGNIQFLGRLDVQVKVKGFRIELAEIESRLREIEYITQAVVSDRKDAAGNTYLCAYLVSPREVSAEKLKDILLKSLPRYMIPSYFEKIAAVPVTPNGKVDRKALPEPKTAAADRDYQPPADHNERLLLEVWRQVLGIEKIGVTDDFFHLGGDSIKAIQIASALRKNNRRLEINRLFVHKTIRQIAPHLKFIDTAVDHSTARAVVQGPVELTPIQLWLFTRHMDTCAHFNQSLMLYRPEGFKETALEKTFRAIVTHHDALRIVYRIRGDDISQENRGIEGQYFELEVFPIHAPYTQEPETVAAEIKREAQPLQRSFNLQTGPLVKLALFKASDGDRLLIIIHHLVIDGISWRILLEDFETAYQQALENKEIQLPPKTCSFQQWAREQARYAQIEPLLRERPFWEKIEESHIQHLPTDFQIEKEKNRQEYFESVSMSLTRDQTRQLLTNVNRAYNTGINDILLAALGLALYRWCLIQHVLINLEGHGREDIIPGLDTHRTVGWFTTQYPVVLDISHPDDISFMIKTVKETLRRIPYRGIGYGILKYLTPSKKKETSAFTIEPEIAFNYLGQFDRGSYTFIDQVSRISDPRLGDSISPNFENSRLLDIVGETSNGILTLSFQYNRYRYRRETVENLVDIFSSCLREIIRHCVQKEDREEREFTPSDFGYNKLSISQFEKMKEDVKRLVPHGVEIESLYPLTPMQQEMFFAVRRNREAYFIQNLLSVPAQADKNILEEAVNRLIRRYDVFRTIFYQPSESEPLQIVLDKRDIEIEVIDISLLSAAEKQRSLEEFMKQDKRAGFDLTRGPLMSFTLFKIGRDSHTLLWSLHHIIMDGWCLPIFLHQLSRTYLSLADRAPMPSEPVRPFRTYIDWLQRPNTQTGFDYWREYLADFEPPPSLSSFGKTVTSDSRPYQLGEYYFTLDQDLSRELARTAARNRVTLNVLFQALWGTLLQQYTRSRDVLFGAVVSGRSPDIEGIEDLMGMFINIIPVRIPTAETASFPQLLQDVQQRSLRSKPHEILPLTEILSNVSLGPGVIDSVMFFENYPAQETRETSFFFRLLESHEQNHYNFSFFVLPGEVIGIRFSYNARIFDRAFIEQIASRFKEIATEVVCPCVSE